MGSTAEGGERGETEKEGERERERERGSEREEWRWGKGGDDTTYYADRYSDSFPEDV